MSAFLLMILLATQAERAVGDASDKLTACVFSRADQFSAAKEGAETVVNAALAACLTERANLRMAMRETMLRISPSLSKGAEKDSFDMMLGAVRDDALVHIMSVRAKNAEN